MVMGLEHLGPLVIATEPAEIAVGGCVALAGAVVALWRRMLVLEDRNAANLREMLNTTQAFTAALRENTEAIRNGRNETA
jgi:hypothetical protein